MKHLRTHGDVFIIGIKNAGRIEPDNIIAPAPPGLDDADAVSSACCPARRATPNPFVAGHPGAP
jgi:hypothetical protein